MANPEHFAKLSEGVIAWNQWRNHNQDIRPDLHQADLRKMDLRGAKLYRAKLRGALLDGTNLGDKATNLGYADLRGARMDGSNLHSAELSVADLRGANLSRACLIGAKLDGANLRDANLTGASLRNADLSGTDFIATNLRGADVDGAVLNRTVFASIDFRSLRGVEGLVHRGPSVIGIDTMYLSKGEFSEIFMRGAGMPDSFIAIARSLAGQAGTFFSCFISYSTKDQDFADRLHADLQNKGVRCWFAPYNISGGKKLREQIDEAIRLHDRLLLILSEHSMNSEWVQTEIAHARQKELTERRQVLFPISLVVTFARIREWKCFDADTGKDSARELREYFIPDFSNWKDGNFYQKGLERLLQDLKSEPARRFR